MRWTFVSAIVLASALSAPAFAAADNAPAATTKLAQQTPDRARDRDRTRDRKETRTRKQIQQQQTRQQRIRQQQRFDWGRYRPGYPPPRVSHYRPFNMNGWQRNWRAERRYRWRPYRRPPGWYYRRWTYGMIFPRPFWARDYWISSYWNFGLMNPPYGYVWVRYGDDALLVSVSNGYVLQVVYGLFD